MPAEGDAGPTTGAVRERLGLIGGESARVPAPGYVDPVDPDLALVTDSGGLSVVRPGDPHVNPDLVSLYGPDGPDGGVTVSTSGTPPVLGSAPMDPPKPMPGGDDSVPGGPLTPGTGWGGGGGYDPTIAGGNDDLDDLEIERLTGGGPSTQPGTSQALGGAGSTIAVPIEGEGGTVDELETQQLTAGGPSTPSQSLATEALGGYDPTIAGGSDDDDLDDLELQRLTGGGPSTPTQSLATGAFGGVDQALGAGDQALAGPTPLAPEGSAPDIDSGPLPEPGEADGLLG
ncbi:MAG: hypothetical protein KatS3mg065_0299 [Chloroflexota bacterium]|nr:MAG: hypothetical protein KatS3mg065_0299 [Chloroflexota bacterium]